MQRITAIQPHSIAEALGIQQGDKLLSINGQRVLDVVDYEFLCAEKRLLLRMQDANSGEYEALIEKQAHEPLGLCFESGLMSQVRTCKNHCIFCFIDQMPKGGRETLFFKDDDWRMSFIMGNYITLTNVDDEEFQRILKRKVSPLYISVHATDQDMRRNIMRNPTAGLLLSRLNALRDAGLRFHCQIVCCPGWNDGPVLQRTLHALFALYPAAQSVAVVPVGLTKFREALTPLTAFSQAAARETLRMIQAFAKGCLQTQHTRFVFPSDELVLLAGGQLPPYADYEDFPQIENGVGLLRLFEKEFLDALQEQKALPQVFRFDAAGGLAANDFFCTLYQTLAPYNLHLKLHAIQNDFFGHSITVGGLVTGQDIVSQVKGKLQSKVLFLPHNMLREGEDVFLDGMTLARMQDALQAAVIPIRGEGEAWIETLFHYAANDIIEI